MRALTCSWSLDGLDQLFTRANAGIREDYLSAARKWKPFFEAPRLLLLAVSQELEQPAHVLVLHEDRKTAQSPLPLILASLLYILLIL